MSEVCSILQNTLDSTNCKGPTNRSSKTAIARVTGTSNLKHLFLLCAHDRQARQCVCNVPVNVLSVKMFMAMKS
jgi:hypothetical protein